MKKIVFAFSLIVAVAMTACTPETLNERLGIPENAILLSSERFSDHGAKTSVSDTTVKWVNTDKVYLNGSEHSVTVDNSGNAYVNASDEIRSSEVYGYYGVSGTPSWNSSTKKLSVTVPLEYTSSYDGGRQVIALPMVAYKSGAANKIEFKHVTSAVKVRVKNTTGTNLMLDSVIVTSETQKLNGSTIIPLKPEEFDVPAASSYTATTKRVIVYFIDQPIIATGGSDIKEIQVPILPIVQKSNDLSIKVYAHKQSGETVSITGVPSVQKVTSYNFSKKDAAPALPRNTMITAQIEIKSTTPTSTIDCSLFSVGSSSRVRFSQGNLQYIGSVEPHYWKFAEKQYEVIDNNSQCTTDTNINRDLFGWGTSGHNNKHPYMVSTTGSDYGNGSGVNIANTPYDWGVKNPISNGGNVANQWRTLTDAEWTYLFKTRAYATLKYGFAQVNGVNGLVVLPDFFVDPKVNNGSSFFVPGNGSSPDWTNNIYTVDGWTSMESAGAIFLPVAGRRSGTTYNSTYAIRAFYWSSTASGSSARYVYFYRSTAGSIQTYLNTGQNEGRYYGFSVRLVKTAE